MTTVSTNKRLVPDSQVRKRYGRTSETLRAWERNEDLKFPKAVRINGRKYRREDELDAFDARCAKQETETAA